MVHSVILTDLESAADWKLLTAKWVNYQNKQSNKELESGRIYGFVSLSRRYNSILIETFSGSNGSELNYPHVTTVERFSTLEIQDVDKLVNLILARAKDYSLKDNIRKVYDDSDNLGSVSIYPFVMDSEDYRNVANLKRFQDDEAKRLESLVQRGKKNKINLMV